jgi:uncharacterized glyoxalase superfamily protein PhnB
MDGTVTVIPIVVSNQANSLEFYTKKAGFEKKTDMSPPGANRWVTVGLKGQSLELALWEAGSRTHPTQKEWSKHWAPARTPPIVVQVSDCKAAYQELSERGVPFVWPVEEQPWGTSATFQDPDGNIISLNQPPGGWTKS